LLEAKPVMFLGDLDANHAWAFTKDVARTLVAASRYAGDWGRAFHVPSQHAPPRDLIRKAAAILGKEVPEIRTYCPAEMEASGMHELVEMTYLFARPSLVDSSDAEQLLGVTASSLDRMLRDTLRGFH
jgi:nucleoside-diphosphate-sugar epimerase